MAVVRSINNWILDKLTVQPVTTIAVVLSKSVLPAATAQVTIQITTASIIKTGARMGKIVCRIAFKKCVPNYNFEQRHSIIDDARL